MITHIERKKNSVVYRLFCLFLSLAFIATTLILPKAGYAQAMTGLPASGSMIMPTPAFEAVMIKGVAINPEHPFQFDFVLDTGDGKTQGKELEKEANKLIKYFLASVTVPDTDMWVNLSPYEKDRIAPEGFGSTEMGRDLLAQDYILKQFTASLIYPEGELGKKFWDRVYKKAYDRFGTTDIPANTFNKVWVIPDKAVVYEHQGRAAFVVERHLKVMLEEDYLALGKNLDGQASGYASQGDAKSVNAISSDIVREIVLPEIEKEVNFGKNFANLRQIYNAMILSTWYKRSLRESIFSQVYANKNKIAGVDVNDKAAKQKIYDQYLETFRKGVYNLVKVDYDPHQKRNVAHKYFSGGCQHVSSAVTIKKSSDDLTGLQQFNLVQKNGPLVVAAGGVEGVKEDAPEGTASPIINKVVAEEAQEPVVANDRASNIIPEADKPSSQGAAVAEEELIDPRKLSMLEKGWVIANHILVSFHAAFITSLLSLSDSIETKWDVLQFVFGSAETVISAVFMWATWHTGIAIHEMGHYLTAVKIDALKTDILPDAKKAKEAANKNIFTKAAYYLKMFATIPYGKFQGVTKSGLNYYADAPYNNKVKAAGPSFSRILGIVGLSAAGVLITTGLVAGIEPLTYIGRLFLGFGAIGILDFFNTDPGEYKKYVQRKKEEAQKTAEVDQKEGSAEKWINRVAQTRNVMLTQRPQIVEYLGRIIKAPWQFRNCGMGGRHTEKEYPESNISMQEMMFVPLGAKSYEDFQETTVKLQNKLKELIEDAEGGRVMGIGLEGGLAPYIEKEKGDKVPEQRMWRMARQAIVACGYKPGIDVAIALDPAVSELEIAYREQYGEPDAVGMYLFWRDNDKVVMTRDEILTLYKEAIEVDDVPIVSLEDGFAEDDHEGWKLAMKEFGDKLFIIGDDNVTTRDSSIEGATDDGEINTFLVKANQIGSLSETLIALAVAISKGVATVTSHRSKSPNDDMEAHIGLAARSVGLKTGGGSNTERLHKYGAVIKVMTQAFRKAREEVQAMSIEGSNLERNVDEVIKNLVVTDVMAWEESTNAGIPTVGVRLSFGIPGSVKYEKLFTFDGATPLGTSAGTGEAIHLVDSVIYRSQVPKDEYLNLFKEESDGSLRFKKDVTQKQIDELGDDQLGELFRRSKRYGGKGVMNAVDNVNSELAKAFKGLKLFEIFEDGSIEAIDKRLLAAELEMSQSRGEITADAPLSRKIEIMQRKGNVGMNAILSQSLAATRLIAKMQGKELWEVLDETLRMTMAKTIAHNGGVDMLSMDAAAKINPAAEELWREMYAKLSFDELSEGMQRINQVKPKDVKMYQLVRQELNVYNMPQVSSPAVGAAASSSVGGVNLNSNLLDLQIKRDAAGSPLPISEQPIFNMNIQGFSFTIKTMTPITSVPMFLGMHKEKNLEETFAAVTL